MNPRTPTARPRGSRPPAPASTFRHPGRFPRQHELAWRQISRTLPALWLLLLMLVPAAPHALAQEPAGVPAPAAPAALDWIEPRGLSIVDVVGQVPEAHLKDAILTYSTSTGIAYYESGQRIGDSVTINVSISPRYAQWGAEHFTYVGCLGQIANYDQWPSTSPAGSVRLYSGGADVTNLLFGREIVAAGLRQPNHSASAYERYPYGPFENIQPSNNAFPVPANMGCRLTARGKLSNLTATFTFPNVPPRIVITPKGEQSFSARSYVGVGSAGTLTPLVRQLSSRFSHRHDKFKLEIPADADFVLVKYPPTLADPYSGQGSPQNQGMPGSGTWRLVQAGSERLSVDNLNSMLTPISGAFNDADQSDGEFLSYWRASSRLAAPEYFVPPGIPYNSCMARGDCPESLLDQIYNASYTLQIFYYHVQRVENAPLQRIPIRQVDTRWSANASAAALPATAQSATEAAALEATALEVAAPAQTGGGRVLLPIVRTVETQLLVPATDPDDPTGCPCGYFDATGRMFDFIP